MHRYALHHKSCRRARLLHEAPGETEQYSKASSVSEAGSPAAAGDQDERRAPLYASPFRLPSGFSKRRQQSFPPATINPPHGRRVARRAGGARSSQGGPERTSPCSATENKLGGKDTPTKDGAFSGNEAYLHIPRLDCSCSSKMNEHVFTCPRMPRSRIL